jgi:FixJ family two-component response regulator
MRLARERSPDVALLDVEMPMLNGPGLAYQMYLHNTGLEDVPVVFISGITNLRDVAASVGTPYFLGKPYRYEDMIALVGRALRERIAPTHQAQL